MTSVARCELPPEGGHNLVFVFGTLKQGFPNFATNRGVRLPGEFQTVACYPLYLVGERWSPCTCMPGQGMQVQGQVFAVSDAALAAMDALERIHAEDGYRRLPIAVVEMAPGAPQQRHVQAYLKPPGQLDPALIRKGPMAVYALADALLYRPRVAGMG
jgi:gamma-glutamylaminecyclotransferase